MVPRVGIAVLGVTVSAAIVLQALVSEPQFLQVCLASFRVSTHTLRVRQVVAPAGCQCTTAGPLVRASAGSLTEAVAVLRPGGAPVAGA